MTIRYPGIQVDVRITNRKVDLVAEGFDAALRVAAARLSDSSLVARRLSTVDLQLFGAPSYLAWAGSPKTAADTAKHQWVAFKGPKLPAPLSSPKDQTRVVSDDFLFIHQAIKAGLGLGALPSFIAREDLAAGRLARVLPRVSLSVGTLHFVHPPSQHVPRKVTALRDYLLEHFHTHPL